MIANVPGFHGMHFEDGNAFQAAEPGRDLSIVLKILSSA